MNDEYENNAMVPAESEGDSHPVAPPAELQDTGKKTLAKRISGALLSTELQDLFGHIWRDIIDPAGRKIIVEAFTAFIMRNTHDSGIGEGFTNYQAPFDDGWRNSSSIKQEFEDIQFKSREEAEHVLNMMRMELKKKHFLLITDYYRIARRKPKYTYYNYGWVNLNSAYIYHYNSNGERFFSIHLPPSMAIDTSNNSQ